MRMLSLLCTSACDHPLSSSKWDHHQEQATARSHDRLAGRKDVYLAALRHFCHTIVVS
jgi:hypothetical protein